MRRVTAEYIKPRPLGPYRGTKMPNIIKVQLQSQFQRFLYQTLCIYLFIYLFIYLYLQRTAHLAINASLPCVPLKHICILYTS